MCMLITIYSCDMLVLIGSIMLMLNLCSSSIYDDDMSACCLVICYEHNKVIQVYHASMHVAGKTLAYCHDPDFMIPIPARVVLGSCALWFHHVSWLSILSFKF
jgi:hypothetical protein